MGNHSTATSSTSSLASAVKPSRNSKKKSSHKKKLDVKSLETALLDLDVRIDRARKAVRHAHDKLTAQIVDTFYDSSHFGSMIAAKKADIIRQVEQHKLSRFSFQENTKNLDEILIDAFYSVNSFETISLRLRYLKFYNEFQVGNNY